MFRKLGILKKKLLLFYENTQKFNFIYLICIFISSHYLEGNFSGNHKWSSLSSIVILNLKQNDKKHLAISTNNSRKQRNNRHLDFSSTLVRIVVMCP